MFSKIATSLVALAVLVHGASATCRSGDYGIGVVNGATTPTGHLLVFGSNICVDLDTNTVASIYGTYHNSEVVSNWSGTGPPPSGFVGILTFPGGDTYTCTTSNAGGVCSGATTVDIAACCARNS